MKRLLATLATLFAAACDRVPLEQPMPSQTVVSWDGLYLTHCAGCHGADGSLGAARPMRDPAYLATLSRDELIRVIGRGQGRLMPAFDQSAGGPLTAEEIARLADGMRQAWVRVECPWACRGRVPRARRRRVPRCTRPTVRRATEPRMAALPGPTEA